MKSRKFSVPLGTFIIALVLAQAGCATAQQAGGGSAPGTGGGSGAQAAKPVARDSGRALADFKAALAALGENTAENPAEVSLALDNLQDS
jgi:hypothetical protein